MRVVVQRVLESLGRAPESLRPSATITHPRHCSSHAYKHQPPKRPDPYNNAMAASVVGLCNTELIRKKRTMAGPRPPRVRGPRVRRLVQPPTTKTSKAQCLALPTTAITWNTTYLSAAINHRLPTPQPPPSIRRHQHNHTTPRPTPTPNRRPNRRFLYRWLIYPGTGITRRRSTGWPGRWGSRLSHGRVRPSACQTLNGWGREFGCRLPEPYLDVVGGEERCGGGPRFVGWFLGPPG